MPSASQREGWSCPSPKGCPALKIMSLQSNADVPPNLLDPYPCKSFSSFWKKALRCANRVVSEQESIAAAGSTMLSSDFLSGMSRGARQGFYLAQADSITHTHKNELAANNVLHASAIQLPHDCAAGVGKHRLDAVLLVCNDPVLQNSPPSSSGQMTAEKMLSGEDAKAHPQICSPSMSRQGLSYRNFKWWSVLYSQGMVHLEEVDC